MLQKNLQEEFGVEKMLEVKNDLDEILRDSICKFFFFFFFFVVAKPLFKRPRPKGPGPTSGRWGKRRRRTPAPPRM
jgi:hypothetical protein